MISLGQTFIYNRLGNIYLNQYTAEQLSLFIHQGPGPDSMRIVASAWKRLSQELHKVASAHEKIISERQWWGLAAQEAATTIQRYAWWLRDTAKLANQVNLDVSHLVNAYELAHLCMVPLSAIQANRARMQQLINSRNWQDLNIAAITENEAEYNAMWTKNIQVLHAYMLAARTVSVLITFYEAPGPATGVRCFSDSPKNMPIPPTVKLEGKREQPLQGPTPQRGKQAQRGRNQLPASSLRKCAQ